MGRQDIITAVIFIAIVLLRFQLQGKNSYLRKFFSNNSFRGIERFKRKHEYDKISKRYRMLAKFKKGYLKENLLGLACVYEYDSNKAVEHFHNALNSAIGPSISSIKNNMTIAYLQNGWYRDTLSILEEQRKEGNLPILTYILTLLINDEDEEAKRFHEQYPLKGEEEEDLKKLLQFSPLKPETLEPVKECMNSYGLWLYKPVIKDLIMKFETDIFYNSKNRYEILEKQAKDLLLEFDKEPTLFSNADVRYMRSIISNLLPHLSSFYDCARLWGLIENYDTFTMSLPIGEKLKEECFVFWRRVYKILSCTSTIETHDPVMEKELIKEQIPVDAKNIVQGSAKCGLYISESLSHVIRSIQVNHDGFVYYYVDLIEKSIANELIEDITPVVELINEDSSTREVLEPLLYKMINDRASVSRQMIVDIFNRIPSVHHNKLDELYNKIAE